MSYHPDFFNPDSQGHRQSCQDRLDLIKPFIEQGSTLLDIGCSGGYFSFGLSDLCTRITGIDSEIDLIQECNEIKKKNNVENVNFDSANIIFWCWEGYDTVLYLAVHHHIIQNYGWQVANVLFRAMSHHPKQMFFEMGQKDEQGCEDYGWWKELPETDDADAWIRNYIKENSAYTNIERLGASPIHGTERHLYRLSNEKADI